MAQIYRRPVQGVPLAMEPQLASWDAVGQPSQTRLAGFLAHVETVAAPMLTGIEGRLAVEMAVGLPGNAPLTTGGRDLDNYLYPVAQRLGPARLAAVFGRKVHGSSWLAIGPALPDVTVSPARYATHLVGSYVRQE